jgi:ABC-type multidrug transport system fused ATPase/permease subunit
MAEKLHKAAFIQRLIGGLFWAAILYFLLSLLGKWLIHGSTLLRFAGVIVIFASFYSPWKWFKWNLTDFLNKEGYRSEDYKINSRDQFYLHRSQEIVSFMWWLTIPFIILCCFLTWQIMHATNTSVPNTSNVIEESQLNDGRFKQGIIDGCKKSPGATDASCGCLYNATLAYYGDNKGIASAMAKDTGADGKLDTNAFYPPELVNKMRAECTTN